jgi:hypothetical protein
VISTGVSQCAAGRNGGADGGPCWRCIARLRQT